MFYRFACLFACRICRFPCSIGLHVCLLVGLVASKMVIFVVFVILQVCA